MSGQRVEVPATSFTLVVLQVVSFQHHVRLIFDVSRETIKMVFTKAQFALSWVY